MSRIAERAVLVHRHAGTNGAHSDRAEFEALTRAAGAEVVGSVVNRRPPPDPQTFLGRGKVEAVRTLVAETAADVVLVDEALSPAQERNLERVVETRVLDRTELILDIFAQRAHSFEGRLEVERAQLRHLATRLVRGWTHLERQKGGIGLRGPGETQLESDRRLIGRRIRQLSRQLEGVAQQRARGRALRRRNEIPVAALVGYTNAGKTSVFNRLAGVDSYAANQLFATLDPLLRKIEVPGIGQLVLADTVGFVGRLPHELVEAFKATLSEARDADILIHVIDAADPDRDEHIAVVNRVLAEIDADELPQIELYNKIDLLNAEPGAKDTDGSGPPRIYASARTASGFDALRTALARAVGVPPAPVRLELEPAAGRLRARLFELDAVVAETPREGGGWLLDVRLPEALLARLLARYAPQSRRPAASAVC